MTITQKVELIYGQDYFGFVYLWYNRTALEMERQDYVKAGRHKRKKKCHPRIYVGCHYGSTNDGYVCSSSWMKAAYKRNPQNFVRRILYWQQTPDKKELLQVEQRWLNLIEKNELGTRFYNLSKTASMALTIDKNQRSEIGRKNWQDPEYRERGLSYLKTYDVKRRRNLSLVLKEKWKDPEYRAKRIASTQNEERNKKIGDAHRGQKHTKETKQRISEAAKKRDFSYLHSPEIIAKRAATWKGRKKKSWCRV